MSGDKKYGRGTRSPSSKGQKARTAANKARHVKKAEILKKEADAKHAAIRFDAKRDEE